MSNDSDAQLMAVNQERETMENIDKLAKALAKFQAHAVVLGNDSEGYGYKYVSLSKVVQKCYPILAECGLSVAMPLSSVDGSPALRVVLMHESGQFLEDYYPLEKVGLKQANDAQKFGAAISYARRYALCSLLGLATDDDDAECLTGAEKEEADAEEKAQQDCLNLGNEIAEMLPQKGHPIRLELTRIWKGKAPWVSKLPLIQEQHDRAQIETSQPA